MNQRLEPGDRRLEMAPPDTPARNGPAEEPGEPLRAAQQMYSALRELEARYHWLAAEFVETQRLAHVGSWQWEVGRRTMLWSDELFRIFGLEPGSVPPTLDAFLARVHPDDRARVQYALAESLQHPRPFAFDHRVVRLDGSIRTVQARGTVNVDAHGQVMRVVGTAHDITAWVVAQEQIRALNSRLEQRVQERTAQLEAANRALRGEVGERQRTEQALQSSRDQLSVILQAAADGITAQLPDGRLIYANLAAARLAGFETAESLLEALPEEVGQRVELLDEASRPLSVEQLPGALALRERAVQAATLRCRLAGTGEERWVRVRAAPIFAPNGDVELVVNLYQDVTEHKRAEIGQRLLAEVGRVLAGPLDYVERLAAVARVMVPWLADWCVVQVLEDGAPGQWAVAHADEAKLPLASELQRRLPWDWQRSPDVREVLAEGQPALLAEITPERLRAVAQDDEHWRLLQALGLGSALVAPLLARGRILGTVTCVWGESGRRYSPADIALVEELARRAALAVDNARLYQAERQARASAEKAARQAEQSADRMARLQVVTALLSEALTPSQVTEVTVRQSVAVTEAAAGAVFLLTPDGEGLELVQAVGYSDEMLTGFHHLSLAAPWPVSEAARTGEMVWIGSSAEYEARYPGAGQLRAPHGFEAAAAVPLRLEGRTVGVMALTFTGERQFVRADRDVLLTLARQCAQALERARLFEAERAARAEAQRLNAELEMRVAERTAELRAANTQLEASRQYLRRLSAYLHAAREEERTRVAREVHDELGQSLTGLKMEMAWLQKHLDRDRSRLLPKLKAVSRLIDSMVQGVRRLATDLRPGILDDLGLLPALEWQVQEFEARTGLRCRLETGVETVDLEPHAATAVFRILQETLSNIYTHARASTVQVTLDRVDDHLRLQVTDDGQGVSEADLNNARSFGLLGLREHLHLLGGELIIQSAPDHGTIVTAQIPVRGEG